ncbi:MAG: phosphate ABC transporter permease PstA [Oscillospiraceae bacterium]|nr:phosphate ABC transporter permease PstA [Oscillospiraceae bacterium]
MNARTSEKVAKGIIWGVAVAIIGALISIMGFILIRGLPAINLEFLTQASYDMGRGGGIFPSIVGTIAITLLAVSVALPFGIGTAFYLAEYTKGGIIPRIIRFGAESLAGIPSIVYGLFGFIFFVDILNLGWSILAGGLTVAIMMLPMIIRTSEEAILAVPKIYREASFSLGATKWQTIRCAVTPSAVRGIANGIILSIGRCIAETAAVMLTAGSALRMADSVFSSTRTMAVHFYLLATEGTAMDNAYGTAAILIILIFLINVVANSAVNRFVAKKNKGAK